MAETIRVAVTYASVDGEHVIDLQVAAGATLEAAIKASGVSERVAGLDLALHKVGVWGRIRPLQSTASDGDRIEIYRPLVADPNTARQRRVAKKKAAVRK